jgi:hypothetical protein
VNASLRPFGEGVGFSVSMLRPGAIVVMRPVAGSTARMTA